jgi:hypothetical protein
MPLVTGPRQRARELRRFITLAESDKRRSGGTNRALVDFEKALTDGQVNGKDHSVRCLFEELVPDGREIVESWDPRNGGRGHMLSESAIETGNFTAISGQIVYQSVLDADDKPGMIGGLLCPDRQTAFDGEKIAGIAEIGDNAEVVEEGGNYPTVGTSAEYIETPRTTKRGFIVPVTKEAIFFDRTGQVLQRAGDVAGWLGINKEKRCIDAAIGSSSIYNRNGRSATTTYGDDSGDHDFDNLAASNALADWTDIENALLLFDGMTDPVTGEPIDVLGQLVLIIPSALKMTAMSVLNATEIREVTNTNTTTLSANPLKGEFAGTSLNITIATSPYVASRVGNSTTWFIGNPSKAFAYGVNWPITSVEAPTNSNDEFHRDIVAQYKVSERGTVEAHNPRFMVKSTA